MSTRTFLALDLDDEVLDRIEEAKRRLQDETTDDVINWVERENLHVTLSFAGALNDAQLAEICSQAHAVASSVEAFDFDVIGLSCQPTQGRSPRMIWADIQDGTGRLTLLQELLNDVLESMGLRQENREFHPHVTLARIKTCNNPAALRDKARELSIMDFGVQHAHEIVVYSSHLLRTGPQYRPVARFELGDSGMLEDPSL